MVMSLRSTLKRVEDKNQDMEKRLKVHTVIHCLLSTSLPACHPQTAVCYWSQLS